MENYKFSIITPEHTKQNLPYLLELWDSIKNQKYTNWEWVLYLNNEVKLDDIPNDILKNEKVRAYVATDLSDKIGKIKKTAFFLGTGDILVEADHDDLLTPDCLEELNIAFQDEEVGFVYSDNATFREDGKKFIPHRADHGWTHYSYNWKGKNEIVMSSPDATSHSVGYIWYAPDHVRSWRKSVYHEIGGHDENYSICDDQELMQRTYLATKFHHINKCLYLYRVTGANTWLKRNADIQGTTKDLFRQNIRKLAEKDAKDRGLMCVDIGGGLNPHPDYVTVDQRDTADYVCDLNDGIPLPDNSVGVLNASHIIEHLHDKHKTMQEIHRVLAHGGWAFIAVPSTDGRGAWQDPTHVSYWNENSFLYYTQKEQATFIDNEDIRFQEYFMRTYYPNDWYKKHHILVTEAFLVAIKEDSPRYPGLLNI